METKVIDQVHSEKYSLYHGDSCEVIKGLPDSSIDYSIFSPPFSSLYTYSASDRDMGNCKSLDEFSTHFEFLAKELHRVIKPGRLLSFHCMQLPASKTRDGYIGLKDFRGDLIRIFQAAGFVFHSEVCIWKDPVTAMQRTKAIGLLHKQVCKDSALSRQGIPDYLVTMRKLGDNIEPVAGGFDEYYGENIHGLNLTADRLPDGSIYYAPVDGQDMRRASIDIWQRYASPVWMDIDPSDTLQKESARANEDERHICLAKGSLVLTYHDGYKPIEEIKVGKDLVLTHKGRWMPVIAKKKTSDCADVVSIKAAGVNGLRVTPTHKLWAKTPDGPRQGRKHRAKTMAAEWVEAQSLLPNSSYVNLKCPPSDESTELTKQEWWTIGRWFADGHLATGTAGRTSLHISGGIHKMDQLVQMMGELAGTQHKIHATCTQVRVKDPFAKLRNILAKCGKLAHEKRLPSVAYRLDVDSSKSLLDGFLSGDGHHDPNTGRWYVTSVSKELLLGLQILIQRVYSATSTLAKGRPEGKRVLMGRTVNCKQEWVLTFKKTDKGFSFIDEEGSWKKVKSVDSDGTAETWNIQVLEDASYTAEGCIVKNCPLQRSVIRRGMQLWTNPGDVVLDPFNGIGSTGHVCVEQGRKYVGIELKDSYFAAAAKNLDAVATKPKQMSLLEMSA